MFRHTTNNLPEARLLYFFPVIVLFGILSFPLSAAGKPPSFQHSAIELKDQEIDSWFITPDMDNDGLNEFIIQSGKKLTVYQVTSPGKTDLKIISVFQLPEDIFLYCFSRLGGDKTGSLIGITPEEIIAFSFDKGIFAKERKTVMKMENSLFRGKVSAPLFKNFIYNSVMIIPQEGKFTFVRSDKESKQFAVCQEIKVPMEISINISDELTEPVSSKVSLPLFYLTDINNDQKDDFVVYFDNYLFIYLQDEKGNFNQACNADQDKIDIALSRRKKQDREIDYELVPIIKDINNDKLPDILVSNGSKGISALYFNKGKGEKPNVFFQSQKPDHIKHIKGWLVAHELNDFNNDGLSDFALILMRKVGFASGLKILLAQTISLEIEIYLGRNVKEPAQFYPANPDHTRTINIPFTLSLNSENINLQTPFLLSFNNDFNRDGLSDLLLKESGSKEISIYYGLKDQIFSRTPETRLTLSAPAEFTSPDIPYGKPLVTDFNGDGQPDIIIHQQNFAGKHHFFEFFSSSR